MADAQPKPAGGCNCNGFCSGATGFGVFIKQLTSCVVGNHISEEEKTGIMWWTKPHKGCGSLDNAHSAFISWLTLMVWAQFVSSILYFILLMILPLEVCSGSYCVEASVPLGDNFMRVIFQVGWCTIWTYVGWWAMESRNRNWTGVYLVLHGLWALAVLINLLNQFDLLTYNFLFIIGIVAYIVLCAAVMHTLVFGCSTFCKLNPDIEAKVHKPSAPAPAPATEP